MIVKVQLPLASNDAEPKALVYNKGRSHQFLLPITKDLKEMMGDDVKAYFDADYEEGKIELYKKVEPQDW